MNPLKYVMAFLLSSCLTMAYATSALTTLTGEHISLNDLKGKWVLINYWASWCQPCLTEIHELNHFYQLNKDKVHLFAVNFEALSVAEQAHLARTLKINYPSLAEDPRELLGLGDLRGVPATFIFNPQGQFIKALYGSQTIKSLTQAINGNSTGA